MFAVSESLFFSMLGVPAFACTAPDVDVANLGVMEGVLNLWLPQARMAAALAKAGDPNAEAQRREEVYRKWKADKDKVIASERVRQCVPVLAVAGAARPGT